MSKTDKTNPTWVKIRRECPERVEIHNHENGVCNFDDWFSGRKDMLMFYPQNCGYTVSYYGYNNGFYPRGPARWLKSEIRLSHGSDRVRLRRDCREMYKLAGEDLEDYDVVNPHHRHGALWDYS